MSSTGADNSGKTEDEYLARDLTNEQGHGYKMYLYEGCYLLIVPPDMTKGEHQIDKMKKLKEVELDRDDIIIFAYPKCGTHWVWEIMEMLRSGVIEYKKEYKETRMLEFIFGEGVEALPRPRILNTHLPLRLVPKDVVRKQLKCVHVVRNPKDVCVSFYNHLHKANEPESYDGTFDEFKEQFLAGHLPFGFYADYLRDWEAETARVPDLPVLNIYYEDIKKNPVQCIKDLAKFLELTVTDKFCEEVAEACTFQKMKKFDENKTGLPFEPWKEGSDGTFFRKGEVGDWKNWFTVAESEKFDKIWNEKMTDSSFKFTY